MANRCVYVMMLLALTPNLSWGAQGDSSCTRPDSNIVPSVCAPTADISCKALNPSADEVRAILKRVLAVNTHALQRKIYLFHYGENPNLKEGQVSPPVAPDDAALAEKYFYDKSSGRSYFNPEKGYSLYTASNPLVSLDYSEDPALLMRIGVPAGVKFLNDEKLSLSTTDAASLSCYLSSQGVSPSQNDVLHANPPVFDPKQFIKASGPARDLVQGVFKDLGIQMLVDEFRSNIYSGCPGLNPQILIIDPSLSPRLEKTLYTLQLESDPSPQKRKDYGELLEYFETIRHSEVTKIQNSVEPSFWRYYRSWAPVIHRLPPGTDLAKFQEAQSGSNQALREKVMSRMFGCSNDPRYKDEIIR